MSRSYSLICTCLFVALACPLAKAQDFTLTDLEGSYGFEAQSSERTTDLNRGSLLQSETFRLLGTFTLDGLGGVTGARKWFRPLLTPEFDGTPNIQGSHVRSELIEQTYVGTYAVDPSGAGTMSLQLTPTPDYDTFNGAGEVWSIDDRETVHFVTSKGGRVLQLLHDVRAVRIPHPSSSLVIDRWILYAGIAERQDDACAPPLDPCDVVALLAPLLPSTSAASSHPCLIVDTEEDEALVDILAPGRHRTRGHR